MENPNVHSFWDAFFHHLDDPTTVALFPNQKERLRFQCVIGFTALDASIHQYWSGEVIPEWDALLTLIHATSPQIDSVEAEHPWLLTFMNRAQLRASLAFLALTAKPEDIHPNYIDFALILLLSNSARLKEPSFQKFITNFFKLQKVKSACQQSGNNFDELSGFEALKLLKDFEAEAQTWSQCFITHSVPQNKNAIAA